MMKIFQMKLAPHIEHTIFTLHILDILIFMCKYFKVMYTLYF